MRAVLSSFIAGILLISASAGAGVSGSPRGGEIVASVGSAGKFVNGRAGWIDVSVAPHSPGSTLKPLISWFGHRRWPGHVGNHAMPVLIKLQGGQPPFHLIANGRALPKSSRRQIAWMPPGRVMQQLTVLDAADQGSTLETGLY